jgi:hypothetical protein
VYLVDLLPAADVRVVDHDLPVEAARAQQRIVEHVDAVGAGEHDDAGRRVEAVHLDKDLVQRVLALVVPTHPTAAAALAPNRVDLVDEDDARRVGAGLLEEVADAGGADADEHLHEVGAGDRVERHAGLPSDCLGQQRLARARRAVENAALGDLGAEALVLGRILQEVHELLHLRLGLYQPGDVRELDADRLVLVEQSRRALPHAERRLSRAAPATSRSHPRGHAAHAFPHV